MLVRMALLCSTYRISLYFKRCETSVKVYRYRQMATAFAFRRALSYRVGATFPRSVSGDTEIAGLAKPVTPDRVAGLFLQVFISQRITRYLAEYLQTARVLILYCYPLTRRVPPWRNWIARPVGSRCW